jgi:hypothetical protein
MPIMIFLGRSLSITCTRLLSRRESRVNRVPLGKNWRSRPLVFSFVTRSQGEWGCASQGGGARGLGQVEAVLLAAGEKAALDVEAGEAGQEALEQIGGEAVRTEDEGSSHDKSDLTPVHRIFP